MVLLAKQRFSVEDVKHRQRLGYKVFLPRFSKLGDCGWPCYHEKHWRCFATQGVSPRRERRKNKRPTVHTSPTSRRCGPNQAIRPRPKERYDSQHSKQQRERIARVFSPLNCRSFTLGVDAVQC
ncbi:hypothetical protein BCR34DRAFT_281216 [Clohesyomyces aquaticus]|uniref:Uncharacterized protein n=1 Tax=Clohesyomyces aquaticus TaxID=1231657 RepID=A0A1Y1ZSZ3_9PLEO|nr:hypothetical protein BCR34DRAFT_281216 [Clohesyomyces aquaticus]